MAIAIDDVSSKAGWSLDGGRTYEVVVQVESDDPIGGKRAIDECNLFEGLAYRYPMAAETPTETDDSSFLQSVSADPEDPDGRVWKVTLQFGRRNPENDSRGPVDPVTGVRDPFAAPPQLRSRGDEEQLFLTHDQAGQPIVNSLSRPFEETPSIPIPVVVFEVTRLERTFDPSIIDAIQGRLNASEWLGWPAKSMLALPITASRDWNDDVDGWAWTVNYAFAYKKPLVVSSKKVRPGWLFRALDADTLDADGMEFLDDQGVAPSQPTLLDGSGGRLAAGSPPVFREFEVFPTADFSALAFPSDLFTAGTPEV